MSTTKEAPTRDNGHTDMTPRGWVGYISPRKRVASAKGRPKSRATPMAPIKESPSASAGVAGSDVPTEEWVGLISTRTTSVGVSVTVPSPSRYLLSKLGPRPPASAVALARVESADVTVASSAASSSSDDVSEEAHRLRDRSEPRYGPAGSGGGPLDRGYPGYLTGPELGALDRFRGEVRRRGSSFRGAIYCLGTNEDEDYALCRWLRARRFDVPGVIDMAERAALTRAGPRRGGFYPDALDALGCEESIFKTQYPHCFTGGHSRKGEPLFFSKIGMVSIDGLGAVTTPEGLNRYQWHSMTHIFAKRLKERQAADPKFQRFQNVVVLDLDHLSRAHLSSKVLDIVQHQSKIVGLCFPEILGACIIINAPTFFSAVWTIIKKFLDPIMASSIEIYSFRSSGLRRLRELIDADQLPSDYGGEAPSIEETILRQDAEADAGVARRFAKLMHLKAHGSVHIKLNGGEEMDVVVFTRSVVGAVFSVRRADGKGGSAGPVPVKCPEDQSNEDADPFRVVIAVGLRGPGKLKVHAEAHKNRFSSADSFLVVGNIGNI